MLTATNLTKRFGDQRVFSRVELDLPTAASCSSPGRTAPGRRRSCACSPGIAAPTAGELERPDRSRIGYLGHEPLVYRELTPLENLDALRAALPRARAGASGSGCCSSGSGSGSVRRERVSTFSRGMQQRLGLCRVLLHEPGAAAARRAVQRARRRRGRAARPDARGARRAARSSSPRTTRGASSGSRRSGSRSHDATSRDVAALARKDLLLELRAKETLPAMLLFVLSALTVFHFALPRGAGHTAALGLLWIALVFTALLGLTRAFVPEREQGMMDALVLAPCDRSAIWLAKSLAVFAFLGAGRARRAAGVRRLLLRPIDGRTVAAVALANVGICAVGTLTGAMAVAGRARELILPLLFLPLAIPVVVGGVGASAGRRRPLPRLPRPLRRRLRAARVGVVRVRRRRDLTVRAPAPTTMTAVRATLARNRLPALAGATIVLFAAAIALIFFYAPTDADQGLSQRIFYFHVPIALTAYACFGWGAWKALLLPVEAAARSADLESYVAIHQGVIFGSLTLLTGSIWAKISWGVWWAWSDDQLVLFLVLFLFYCAYFMLRYSVDPGPARANMSRRLRALRRRADPGLVPRDPALEELHPPGRVHLARAADDGLEFLTFCVSLAAMLSLFATLYQLELAGKRLDAHLRELRELLA